MIELAIQSLMTFVRALATRKQVGLKSRISVSDLLGTELWCQTLDTGVNLSEHWCQTLTFLCQLLTPMTFYLVILTPMTFSLGISLTPILTPLTSIIMKPKTLFLVIYRFNSQF